MVEDDLIRFSISDVATAVLAVCAVTVTGLLVKRELVGAQPAASAPFLHVSDWKSYAKAGNRFGETTAAVTVVEFSDFQCPFCRQSAQNIGRLIDSLPGAVNYVFRQYPLTAIHPHAMSAAIASECAATLGRFRSYHDLLFANQDSIGSRTWTSFAKEAGIADTTAFQNCMTDTSAVMPRIRADMLAGSKLGVRGTPALLIQDRLFSGLPSDAELTQAISRAAK